jgi:hypothetical protein
MAANVYFTYLLKHQRHLMLDTERVKSTDGLVNFGM